MRRSPIEQDGSNTSQKRLQVGSNSCRITRSSKLPSKKSHSRPKPTSKRQELPSRIYHQQHPRHSWKQFRPLRQFLWNRRRAREKQTQRRKSCKATCKTVLQNCAAALKAEILPQTSDAEDLTMDEAEPDKKRPRSMQPFGGSGPGGGNAKD